MELLKFKQLQIGHVYLLHPATGVQDERRWLFKYIGGNMLNGSPMSTVIFFPKLDMLPPTHITRETKAIKGENYNEERNRSLEGYEDVTGTRLERYYLRVNCETRRHFADIWEAEKNVPCVTQEYTRKYPLTEADAWAPTQFIHHFNFLP